MNLYWCETGDHDEDWFMVASSAVEASRFHEEAEGYGIGDAHATFVCRIPKKLSPQPGWPDNELLLSLGAIFLSRSTPRVVQIGATVYREGGMDAVVDRLNDDLSEVVGKGRPNKTSRLQ